MKLQNAKKLNIAKKRGFTLAESVLALAVISIVSVSALTLIISAQKSTISATQKQQAQLFAADIIACYRVQGDFRRNVEFALGLPENSWDGESGITLKGGLTATVNIDENNKLTVVITDNKEKELTSLSFTKGETTP